MTTATKQIYYSPPQTLLTKRKRREGGRPTLTVAIPFSFSARLSRCDRRLRSASTTTTTRATSAASLPRLQQRAARPSAATTSSTDNSGGSVVRRAGSACESASASRLPEPRGAGEPRASEAADGEEPDTLSPEEEKERRHSHRKCVRWLQGLPDKFSGLHIVQPMVHADSR